MPKADGTVVVSKTPVTAAGRKKLAQRTSHMSTAFNGTQFRRLIVEVMKKHAKDGSRISSGAIRPISVFVERTIGSVFNLAAISGEHYKRRSVSLIHFKCAELGLLHPEMLEGPRIDPESFATVGDLRCVDLTPEDAAKVASVEEDEDEDDEEGEKEETGDDEEEEEEAEDDE